MPVNVVHKNTPAPSGTLAKRPPIVVVMGHVDHGKTTLLDYIRKTNVASREAGGITQSIGAYEIEHCADAKNAKGDANDARCQKITFIDTPGHEAFSKMRERGAAVADIAILVVGADDGVQPQTKEAIKILTDSKTHFIVAINKVDKAGETGVTKTKNELTAAGVLLEGYGGSVSYHEISAKTGQGVNELLDLILLAAEVEHLTYDPAASAEGFIIEAKRDGRSGVVAHAIMRNGTLRVGDRIAADSVGGQVKALENFLGKRVQSAEPSSPVRISGFEGVPPVGAVFRVGALSEVTKAVGVTSAQKPIAPAVPVTPVAKGENVLRVMLKADVAGSLEALTQIMTHLPLPKNTKLKIMDSGIGEITDGDVQHAISTGSTIIGFRTEPTKAADTLAKIHKVKIMASEIVYELVKALEAEAKAMAGEQIAGELEVLAIFGKKDAAQIVGGRVVKGVVKKNETFGVIRGTDRIAEGRIVNLQQSKRDAAEVTEGNECGLLVKAEKDIKVGDRIVTR